MDLLKKLKEGAEQRLAGRKETETILNEWIELNDDDDVLSNPGLYAPFQDETTCNVLLWKY